MTNNALANTLRALDDSASQDFSNMFNTVSYFFYAVSGLTAVALVVLSASRLRVGDTGGCILGLIGSFLCALAPHIAKNFI